MWPQGRLYAAEVHLGELSCWRLSADHSSCRSFWKGGSEWRNATSTMWDALREGPPEQTLGVQGSESRRHVEEISQREQTHKTLSVAVTDASRSSEEPRGAGAESGQPGRRRGPDL